MQIKTYMLTLLSDIHALKFRHETRAEKQTNIKLQTLLVVMSKAETFQPPLY
jgi:hypothetical protein